MSRRSSSRSSSGSDDDTSGRDRNFSETSREATQSESHVNARTATNTIDGTSIADTATIRSASPTASHTSGTATGSGYDTVSIATTTKTGVTNASQQPQMPGSIPIIRPPVLQQQTNTGTGVVGPQRPAGYPTQSSSIGGNSAAQKPIQIDVAAAQQQYQQRGVQPEISPYSTGSTASSTSGSLSSPGTASIQQQPRYNPGQTTANQSSAQQQQQQQAQFANQIPAHLIYNELLGPDAFKDVILDIDYGAMGGFNAAFQSGGDFSGGQLPPGISVRSAYTTVDSLNYQQHMFNTARTIYPGSEGNQFDYSGMSNNYNTSGGQQFDVAKAIFNQVDANQDGAISQQEFQQWAQGGQQNYGGQSYSANAASFQNAPGNMYQASLFDGANPDVASILQQSGLGQVVPNH